MKNIKLHLLCLVFVTVPLKGMDQKKYFSELRDFPKPGISKKVFWLQTDNDQLIEMNYREAKKHTVLSYYIARFGYANKKKSPLRIGCKDQLNELKSKDIDEFLREIALQQFEKQAQIVAINEKELRENGKWRYAELLEALEINKRLPESQLDLYIAYFLQQLHKDNRLSFVFNHLLYHNSYSESYYKRKIFFNNKKFYWQKDISKDKERLYDQEGNLLLVLNRLNSGTINNGLRFAPAHNGNIIMTCTSDGGIRIYNLETGMYINFNGDVENLEISEDGRYIALRCSDKINTIQIYNIQDIGNIYSVAEIDEINANDFTFSPNGLKLITWTDPDRQNASATEITVWDLSDIKKINENKKRLFVNEPCTQVLFNADNEHICILDAKKKFDQQKNKFKKIRQGIIAHIDKGELSRFGKACKAFIFPENSDLIMVEEDRGAGGYVVSSGITLYDKTGKELFLPKHKKHCSYTINGNYILAQNNQRVHLFDHEANLITTLNNNEKTEFKLEPSTENALKRCINFAEGGELFHHRFYYPLPRKSIIDKLHRLSENITAPQLIFLQEICAQKRRPGEFLMINQDNKLAMQIFQSFDPQDQSFLQKELRLIVK